MGADPNTTKEHADRCSPLVPWEGPDSQENKKERRRGGGEGKGGETCTDFVEKKCPRKENAR